MPRGVRPRGLRLRRVMISGESVGELSLESAGGFAAILNEHNELVDKLAKEAAKQLESQSAEPTSRAA